MKVKVVSSNQIYDISSDAPIESGSQILIEAENIIELAIVLCAKDCPKNKDNNAKAKFVRVLSKEDQEERVRLKKIADGFVFEAQNKAFRHGLQMKIFGADISADQKKLTFYFTSENRIDFRGLVADMAGDFKKIIRLQQVNSREESKIIGGFGECGRELCCSKVLNNLDAINSQMSDIQENQGTKQAMYTGCCGKLMCCLTFENAKSEQIKTKIEAKK